MGSIAGSDNDTVSDVQLTAAVPLRGDQQACGMRELLKIMDDFQSRGVDVVFFDQNIDTTQAGVSS